MFSLLQGSGDVRAAPTRVGFVVDVSAESLVAPGPVRRSGSLVFPKTVDLAKDAAIAPFRERPVVVLSPHFDDACFSLGSFLASIGHGTVVNIFTQGLHLNDVKTKAQFSQKLIYAIRDYEDEAFCRRCGLARDDLGCEEPVLRGRRPADLDGVHDDLSQITGPVLRALGKLSGGRRGYLFVPLGIGPHVNHRATTECVLRHMASIGRHYDVMFYEDQPYARALRWRIGALERVSRRVGLSARHVLARPWKEKKALIGFYPTQQQATRSSVRFWPRAVWPLKPHEAFWSTSANQA